LKEGWALAFSRNPKDDLSGKHASVSVMETAGIRIWTGLWEASLVVEQVVIENNFLYWLVWLMRWRWCWYGLWAEKSWMKSMEIVRWRKSGVSYPDFGNWLEDAMIKEAMRNWWIGSKGSEIQRSCVVNVWFLFVDARGEILKAERRGGFKPTWTNYGLENEMFGRIERLTASYGGQALLRFCGGWLSRNTNRDFCSPLKTLDSGEDRRDEKG
jgi:hypothetical protein